MSFPQASTPVATVPEMVHPMVKMEMRPIHRIPSLPIIDPGMMAIASDDPYHTQRQEIRVWDGYPPEWVEGQNVWGNNMSDIPGSTHSSFCIHK